MDDSKAILIFIVYPPGREKGVPMNSLLSKLLLLLFLVMQQFHWVFVRFFVLPGVALQFVVYLKATSNHKTQQSVNGSAFFFAQRFV